jgi:hypothetical protein
VITEELGELVEENEVELKIDEAVDVVDKTDEDCVDDTVVETLVAIFGANAKYAPIPATTTMASKATTTITVLIPIIDFLGRSVHLP